AFPERFHHPKEDAYLFKFLRMRNPEAGPLVTQLESEHRAGAEKIRVLEQALERYEYGGAREFPGFAEAVQAYAAFHWDHMRTEEDKLLPLARLHLQSSDEVARAAGAYPLRCACGPNGKRRKTERLQRTQEIRVPPRVRTVRAP